MRALGFFIVYSVAGSIWPAVSAAQASGYGAQVIRCESKDGRHRLCPVDARAGATLVRQLSRSVCVRNQTWGADQRGIWVSQGCRAEFRMGRRDIEDSDAHSDAAHAHVVRCESRRGAPNECRVDVRGGVRVSRQLSSAPCVAGRSWGHGRGVIWVSQGCRADFVIGTGRGNRGDENVGIHPGPARVIRCESQDGEPQRCDVMGLRNARMLRQLSRSPCVEGRSWGRERDGVWVAEGCRAEFSVW